MVNDKFPYFLKFRNSEKIVTATFAKIQKLKIFYNSIDIIAEGKSQHLPAQGM